jgi:DNA-binding response OmpR family regulator
MRRILLIEDDPDQALLTRDTLESTLTELELTEVSTGAAALALDLDSFDAILLDNNLPDTTGLELLRKFSDRPHGPVIMVTSDEVIEIAVDALKIGAADFILKSLELHQLLPHIVEKTISAVHQRRAIAEGEIRDREKKVQIETLKRIMMTLAHHINNAIMPITFSAELCQRSEYAVDTTRRLVESCLKETQRIIAIIERFEQYVESEEFKYTDYLDLKNAMFDVQQAPLESE